MTTPLTICFRLFLLCLAGLVLSCESGQQALPATGYEYFPLTIGQYVQYRVEETTYALAQPSLTRTYETRETITDSFTSGAGQTIYRIERAVRQPNDEWQVDSVMTAWRTTDRALRMENGVTEVKLVFPLTERQRWNGNLYNVRGERIFEATQVAQPLSLGTMQFDSTVTVVQQNDSSLVALRRHREVYARNVGLVQRERTYVYYCSSASCAGQGIIDYGLKQISTVTGYGKRNL